MLNFMTRIVVLACFTGIAAQCQTTTSVLLNRLICPGSDATKARLLMYIPTGSISLPMCVVLGTGLALDLAAPGGPAIVVTITQPTVQVLTPVVDTLALDPTAIPLATITTPYTLSKTPAPNSFLTAVFRSSVYPGDTVAVIPNPQQTLTITLPTLRSNLPGDSVTFSYFTTQ